MEEKKFDVNSIIGFVLIFGILIFMFYQNQPTAEELEAEKAKQEQVEAAAVSESATNAPVVEQTPQLNLQDSTAVANYQGKLGAFGFTKPSNDVTTLENDVLTLKISNKGGQIVEAKMKNFVTFDSVPVYLIKDGNASFGLDFSTSDNRVLNTQELYFEPSLSDSNGNQVLSLKAKTAPNSYLEYRYEMKPDDYLVDFSIRTKDLDGFISESKPVKLDWTLKGIRHSKSIEYENRYTRLTYSHEDDKISKLSEGSDDEETEEENIKWISYRQHFFSSILAADQPFKSGALVSTNLVEEESRTFGFTKIYSSQLPIEMEGGEISKDLHWYFGPTDVDVLSKYDENEEYKDLGLVDSIPFGWGIFGWINRYVFTPFYSLISTYFPYGIAIVIMTILVRLAMSPVTYKSYLSQAKMKVLKPEITELGEKYKDNAMKKQQETMKLYGKAGVSPMSGCVPAVIQMPIFYALFMFFPTSFALRQKSFLWADDLSSFDTIYQFPEGFSIPFYGDHVSLFPILASIAIFFYMMMTTGQNMPTQPGMPNMKFIMYLMPFMMLFFFNNYASGLSLYYFVSNLITIGIMLVIKTFILDNDKIHAQIQENKKKPKKENKFQRKMREMMEQAEAQKKK
ncbi:MAG: membrane protein insertase YidC [Maribacter sp.]